MCAVMTCSSGMKRRSSPFAVSTKRGKFDGIFILAKSSDSDSGFLTTTARFSESPEIYGNGCEGSTASGVRTGKILLLKVASTTSRSTGDKSSHLTIPIFALVNCGKILS